MCSGSDEFGGRDGAGVNTVGECIRAPGHTGRARMPRYLIRAAACRRPVSPNQKCARRLCTGWALGSSARLRIRLPGGLGRPRRRTGDAWARGHGEGWRQATRRQGEGHLREGARRPLVALGRGIHRQRGCRVCRRRRHARREEPPWKRGERLVQLPQQRVALGGSRYRAGDCRAGGRAAARRTRVVGATEPSAARHKRRGVGARGRGPVDRLAQPPVVACAEAAFGGRQRARRRASAPGAERAGEHLCLRGRDECHKAARLHGTALGVASETTRHGVSDRCHGGRETGNGKLRARFFCFC
eukprot:scaffold21690_cov123-Isochrysis_galbana.AAC.1